MDDDQHDTEGMQAIDDEMLGSIQLTHRRPYPEPILGLMTAEHARSVEQLRALMRAPNGRLEPGDSTE